MLIIVTFFYVLLFIQDICCSQPSIDGSNYTSDGSDINTVESEHSTRWFSYDDVGLDSHHNKKLFVNDEENTATVDEDIPSDYYIET